MALRAACRMGMSCNGLLSSGWSCGIVRQCSALDTRIWMLYRQIHLTSWVKSSDSLAHMTYGDLLLSVSGGRGSRGGRRRGARKGKPSSDVLTLGKAGMKFPGLNSPLPPLPETGLSHAQRPISRQSFRSKSETDDEDDVAMVNRRKLKEHVSVKPQIPYVKGWSGKSWEGRSYGSPETPDGSVLDAFDSRVIELTNVAIMTHAGRKRRKRAVVVVGNKNGAAGFAVAGGGDAHSAMRKARNQAANVLQFVERYNEHTIYHDVKSRFCRTNVIMQKRVKGYGLKCHRIVTEICKLVGISDLRCKVIGSKNRLNVVQAAFKALCSQETPQMLADRTGLRVVEMRSEMGMRPVVLAVPEKERVLYEKTRQAVGYGRH